MRWVLLFISLSLSACVSVPSNQIKVNTDFSIYSKIPDYPEIPDIRVSSAPSLQDCRSTRKCPSDHGVWMSYSDFSKRDDALAQLAKLSKILPKLKARDRELRLIIKSLERQSTQLQSDLLKTESELERERIIGQVRLWIERAISLIVIVLLAS